MADTGNCKKWGFLWKRAKIMGKRRNRGKYSRNGKEEIVENCFFQYFGLGGYLGENGEIVGGGMWRNGGSFERMCKNCGDNMENQLRNREKGEFKGWIKKNC